MDFAYLYILDYFWITFYSKNVTLYEPYFFKQAETCLKLH